MAKWMSLLKIFFFRTEDLGKLVGSIGDDEVAITGDANEIYI